MENSRANENLLRYVGAQLKSVEINGQKENCVVIPVRYNDIFVSVDKDGNPVGASVELRQWTTNEKFRQSCIDNNSEKEGYVPPTHQIQVNYSEKFREAAICSAEKRLRSDEAFMSRNLSDEQIKKEAEYAVNDKARIGYVYPLKKKEPQQYNGQAASANAGSWVPPAHGSDGHVEPTDDLPF